MNSQRGYALFLVAVVIAVMALVLLTVASVQGGLSPTLRRVQAEERLSIAAESASARAAFLLATEPIGPRSVMIGAARDGSLAGAAAELRLDGRFYRIGDDVAVSIQDEAGLVNLNAPDERPVSGLLRQAGAAGVQRLAAALADFVDEDDLERALGAEARAYARARVSPPPNEPMLFRWDALGALGWRAALPESGWEMIWRNSTALPQQAGININTAPRTALLAVSSERRAVDALVERRESAAIMDVQEAQGLLGIDASADGSGLAVRPGVVFRVIITYDGDHGRQYLERRLTLSGEGADRPVYWREERRGQGGAWIESLESAHLEPLPQSAAFTP